MTNPYAQFLGDANARETIAETAGHLQFLFDSLGPERAEIPPAPGKWSAREIICHLADCEIVFGFRLRQALAQEDYVIQPFDQDRWAARYAGFDAASALAVFTAVRNWNLRLIAGMTPSDTSRKLTHPERGEMTVETVIETMAGHDRNHLLQIQAIADKSKATAAADGAYNTSGGV